jgi:hypothetical protein
VSAAIAEETDVRGSGAGDLLRTLRSLGVVLVVDGERLRLRVPRGVLTPALRAALDRERDALRLVVAAQFRDRTTCVVARADVGLVQQCRRMSPCARPVDGRPCLMPPTCCVCGEALEPGHRYVCPACANPDPTMSTHRSRQGGLHP